MKDSDTREFESDMKSTWDFLEECHDEKWRRERCIKQFGRFSKGYLAHGLGLEKSSTVIDGNVKNRIEPYAKQPSPHFHEAT